MGDGQRVELTRGVITLAFGDDRYVRMATTLARSIKRNWPGMRVAVVTDRDRTFLDASFDDVIPLDPAIGRNLQQKLSLDAYSPYHETLFIDSDCIVVRNMDFVWSMFAGREFSTCGNVRADGEWMGASISKLTEELGLSGGLPVFNSGALYWRKGATAHRVFNTARQLIPRYAELGFGAFRQGFLVNDEPLIAIGMASAEQRPVPDDGLLMRTPLQLEGRIQIDSLKGYCRFVKAGQVVQPACVHFCGPHARFGYYKREARKINLSWRHPSCERLSSGICDVIYGPQTLLDHSAVWATLRGAKRLVARLTASAQPR